MYFFVVIGFIGGERVYAEESVQLQTYSTNIQVPIQSWKTLRDARVVKQSPSPLGKAAFLLGNSDTQHNQRLTCIELLSI